MKRIGLILLAVLLGWSGVAHGQTVGANQIKKKTNGGVVADSANAIAVGVYRGTSSPATPVTGQLWCDTNTTPCTLKHYNGSAWTASPSTTAGVIPAATSLPGSPTDGQVAWWSLRKVAVIYDSATSRWYYLDGSGRYISGDYSLENAGYSSSFLSAPGATSGSATTGGSGTAGNHVCATSFYNSTGGETMVGASSGTITLSAGNPTAALTIPTGGAGTVGRRVYCTKAGGAILYYVGNVADNTTGTYNMAVADSTFINATAPDEDFSAPIPSGWTVVTDSFATGGCGSTGTSLLCVDYAPEAAAVAASGTRLLYDSGSSAGGWTASWRVDRLGKGFANATSTCTLQSTSYGIGYAVAANSTATPSPAWGIAQYRYTAGNGLSVFPISGSLSLVMAEILRGSGAAWSSVGTGSWTAWPAITSFPAYVRVVHLEPSAGNYALKGYISQDGANYVAGVYSANDPATAEVSACAQNEGGSCHTFTTRYVGPAIERLDSTGTCNALLVEISDFTYTNN